MPLLFVGGAAFVLAYLSFRGNLSPLPGHYPIWVLFALVGAVATGGSLTAAALPETEPIGDLISVPRAEWEELQRSRAVASTPRSAPPARTTASRPAPAPPPAEPRSAPPIDGLFAELEALARETNRPRSAELSPHSPWHEGPEETEAPTLPAAKVEPVELWWRAPGSPPSLTFCRGCGRSRHRWDLVGRCQECGEPICQECLTSGRKRRGFPICSACADLQDAVDGKLPSDDDR